MPMLPATRALYATLAVLSGSIRADSGTTPFDHELVDDGLGVPIAMAWTDLHRVLITDKVGFSVTGTCNIWLVEDGVKQAAAWATVSNCRQGGEQGLLGIALDPDYASNNFVYAYLNTSTTHPTIPNAVVTRIIRFTDNGANGINQTTVIDNLPNSTAASNHDGGNVHFGPDGYFYVTLGDDGDNSCNSQDLLVYNGKLLRYDPSTVPMSSLPTNPFFVDNMTDEPRDYFFCLGLRNSFDFTFLPGDLGGFIFATENGPGDKDEVNKLDIGLNYGWPREKGGGNCSVTCNTCCTGGSCSGCAGISAVPAQWCYTPTIAPTGIVFNSFGLGYPSTFLHDLFFVDNNNGLIRRADLNLALDTITSVDDGFLDPAGGSLTDIELAPDGYLYFLDLGGELRRIVYTDPLLRVVSGAAAGGSSFVRLFEGPQ